VPEYVHKEPGTEVRFIAGHYTIIEEGRIAHGGRELVYVVGIATVGNSCCGTQGCRFVNIPGYCVVWKHRLSESGIPVSVVDPVESEAEQAEIREMLARLYPHSQILFPVWLTAS
jgi:hypothetical protein